MKFQAAKRRIDLNIGIAYLIIIKAAQHANTFDIGWHKE